MIALANDPNAARSQYQKGPASVAMSRPVDVEERRNHARLNQVEYLYSVRAISFGSPG